MKKIISAFVIVSVLFIGLFIHFLRTPLLSVADKNKPLMVTFYDGESSSHLVKRLIKQHTFTHPFLFKFFVRFHPAATKLQAGTYAIETEDTPLSFMHKLEKGIVVTHQFTIVEGLTSYQVIKQIAKAPDLKHQKRLLKQWATFLKRDVWSIEGQLLANTYQYRAGDEAISLLKQAHEALKQSLATVWHFRTLNVPYKTPYMLLIAASIIEKETAIKKERALVSSVIVNRLRKKMRLQMDPTVIFGLGDLYQGKLTKAHLYFDTPFNTYLHKGLPPTPIAIVGEASLISAAQPAESDFLYFVAVGDGSHQFSETLKEQQLAIKRYIKTK